MQILKQHFQVSFDYPIYFTDDVFAVHNPALRDFLISQRRSGFVQKVLVVVDDEVYKQHPGLSTQIKVYFRNIENITLVEEMLRMPGGEQAKNNTAYFDQLIEAIHRYKVDRHSYVVAIGGGSVLDLVGYAAAVAHRGIRHIRVPTTVLSQDDSGVGVKNGVNFQGKKNFLGTFSPPVAVFNDYQFLSTLSDRHWLAGISEAIKVALIKDAAFFDWLEEKVDLILQRDEKTMKYLLAHGAALHVAHIASGDPFELGSSRPLDFGHWSAHKLEQMTGFEMLHGEAVAIGIALDSVYSLLQGYLPRRDCLRILQLLQRYKLAVFDEILNDDRWVDELLKGLEEFREHLGGELTIMLLHAIGEGYEVHEMNEPQIGNAISMLEKMTNNQTRIEFIYGESQMI